MKVVVNRCYGGFGLSDAACEWLMKNRGYTLGNGENKEDWQTHNIVTWTMLSKYALIRTPNGVDSEDKAFRSHPDIIAVIEALGEAADGMCAKLEIVEIPDGIEWHVSEYDGIETVHEDHRSW